MSSLPIVNVQVIVGFTINAAELVLLNNLDPGELYEFELADRLSRKLLTDWLSTAQLGRELGLSRQTVLSIRHKLQASEPSRAGERP